METAIIIEYSNPLDVRIVKTIHVETEADIYIRFNELIHDHLRSAPEVIEKDDYFRVIEGLDKTKFPGLPLHKSYRSWVYKDYYGKWKLIIL